MKTITISAKEIESNQIKEIMDQLFANPNLLRKCMQISFHRNVFLFEAVHAIALHLSKTGTDYIYEIKENQK